MATAKIAGRDLPPPQAPFVDKGTLNLSYDGLNYLLDLLNSATASLSKESVDATLKSTGANLATALQITKQWNAFTAVPAGSGAILAVLQPGQSQIIFNRDPLGAPLLLYPSPGQQIDALGANQPYSLAAGKMQIFYTISSLQLFSQQLG